MTICKSDIDYLLNQKEITPIAARNLTIRNEFDRLIKEGNTGTSAIDILSERIWYVNQRRICLSSASIRKIVFQDALQRAKKLIENNMV